MQSARIPTDSLSWTPPDHTHVIAWENTRWPAWVVEGFIVVDLRLYASVMPGHDEMVFRPEVLARIGVPDEVILDAASPEHEGFAILEE